MKKGDVIIGMGEIGASLSNALEIEPLYVYDKNFGEFENPLSDTSILHICFPYYDGFIKDVKGYQKKVKPDYTLIHSTVPVGTSRKCNAVHSPVNGFHPHLEESLKEFIKFFGGEKAGEVADLMRRRGFKIYITDKPETTELMKILCTTNYGLNIEFTKEAKRLCDKYGVPFEFFTLWNNNYNEGCTKMGHPEFHRYNLSPMMKKIGGHCVLNNYKLLESKFIDFLESIK